MWRVFDDRTDETLHINEDIFECISFISQQTDMDYDDFNHLTIDKLIM